MDLQAICSSGAGAIQWLAIPNKDFLVVDLEPGIYYLRSRFVPDQCAALSVGKDEGWGRMSWNSIAGMRSNSEDSKGEFLSPIEEMQYSLLETVIMDKLKVLHGESGMDSGGSTLELQNLNGLLLMGFDYYAYESFCTALAGEEHLVNFLKTNPCLYPVIDCNSSPTASKTDTPEIEDKIRLKCKVHVQRLEDELPAERVEKLWKSYNSYKESIKRQTDNDDNEDHDGDVKSVTKRRRGRPRRQESKLSSKKKSVKPKYRMSRESCANDSDSSDDYGDDEDYVPLGKRRTNKNSLRRRN